MVTTTRTPPAVAHNLPASVTSFIGRRREIDEIVCLLGDEGPTHARLVTLTGPGGVGKTRLALEVGARLRQDAAFEDGVWFVELAALGDARSMAQALAAVFRLQEEPDRSQMDVVIDALKPRHLLLIVDNCEHLVGACADLAEKILRACPRVSVLATSREPLRVGGETMRRVPSLPWQDPRARPSIDQICTSDAVRLFTDRAAAASGEFALDEHNARLVAQVCARLDGIPLALELAAARTRALSVDQIAARLDDRFRLLGDGSRTAPPRQQTLLAAVAWSYDLLDAEEQRLLARLAIFAGGWTLEDVEAVCSADDTATPVLATLARLVEKSLVVAEDGPGGNKWFRLLETIRQFASERLRAAGDDEFEVRTRHFEWYVQVAEDSDQCLRWSRGVSWRIKRDWLVRLTLEHANLRVAWQWALDGHGDLQAALRMVAALFPYFWSTGQIGEGRSIGCAVIALDESKTPTLARAAALSATAKLTNIDGDHETARLFAAEYLALPEALRNDSATALVHNALALEALYEGDVPRARTHVLEALTLVRRVGEFSLPVYTNYLGAVEEADGDLDAAEAAYEVARREGLEHDFPIPIGLAISGLARIARARGDIPRSRRLYEEALAMLREQLALPREISLILVALGDLAREGGDPALASARLGEALDLASVLGNRAPLIAALEAIGVLVATSTTGRALVQLEDGVRLIGAAAGLRSGTRLALPAAVSVQQAVGRMRGRLGAARVETLLGSARYLSAEDAVTLGRSVLGGLDFSAHDDTVPDGPPLTRREREVAALVARGASNRHIAETLVIGERTAEMHVSRLLTKLDFASRTQIAAWAVERRLHVDTGK